MGDTVDVASRVSHAVRIREPHPNPEKPGLAPPLKEAVILGARSGRATGGAAVTHGVDADLFRKWHDQMKEAGDPLADLIYEARSEEEEAKVSPVDMATEQSPNADGTVGPRRRSQRQVEEVQPEAQAANEGS